MSKKQIDRTHLVARAREHYDLDRRARLDGAPLTKAERAAMNAEITRIDGKPAAMPDSDVYVSGLYLGAIRRESASLERARADEDRARVRADAASRAEYVTVEVLGEKMTNRRDELETILAQWERRGLK